MNEQLTTEESITIDAPIARVWEALTTPALIKRWFFGVDTETDWSEGSPIVHRGEYQGKPYQDKGTIVKVEPERRLVHTHWSSVSGLPDSRRRTTRRSADASLRGGRAAGGKNDEGDAGRGRGHPAGGCRHGPSPWAGGVGDAPQREATRVRQCLHAPRGSTDPRGRHVHVRLARFDLRGADRTCALGPGAPGRETDDAPNPHRRRHARLRLRGLIPSPLHGSVTGRPRSSSPLSKATKGASDGRETGPARHHPVPDGIRATRGGLVRHAVGGDHDHWAADRADH